MTDNPVIEPKPATSPIGQSDIEMLKHLADSMGFGRTHDMLRRVIAATPYFSTPVPSPDGAAKRTAPESCPHCFNGDDCSNINICNAVQSNAPPPDDVRSALARIKSIAFMAYKAPTQAALDAIAQTAAAALRSAPVSAPKTDDAKPYCCFCMKHIHDHCLTTTEAAACLERLPNPTSGAKL